MNFKNEYIKWLDDNIYQCRINESTIRLTLPFLDRNNDYIECYIVEETDKYIVTDNSNTFSDIEFSGINTKTASNKKLIENIISSYGIRKNDKDELFIECSLEEVSTKINSLFLCILKLSQLKCKNI